MVSVKDMLRKPEIIKRIGELNACQMSMEGMAEIVKEEFGIETTSITLKSAIDVAKVKQSEIIKGDEEVNSMMKESVINVYNELKYINDKMHKIADEVGTDNKDVIAACNAIDKQINTQMKIIEQLTQGFDFKHVNTMEISKEIVRHLSTWERDGYIKILKAPGEVVDIEANRNTEHAQNKVNSEELISHLLEKIEEMETFEFSKTKVMQLVKEEIHNWNFELFED